MCTDTVTAQQPRIQPLDPADEATFADYYDVVTVSRLHDRSDLYTPPGVQALRDGYLRAPSNTRNNLFMAYDGATPVAAGCLNRDMTANRHLAILAVDVHPDHRGRGFGSATLDRLEAEAIAAKRTALYVETFLRPDIAVESTSQYKFASRHGYQLALIEQRRRLDLPAKVDLDALARAAAGHHHGYRIITFQGPVPDDYLVGYSGRRTPASQH